MEISPTAGKRPIAIIGAGIGGLAAAIDLAVRGFEVCMYERAATPGGKMREIEVGGRPIDVGPTVLTLREIFDEIFAAAGARLDEHLRLRRAELLARHAWDAGARLDLYADPQRSIDAIGRFAGARDARGYRDFVEATRRTYAALERSFVRATRPSMLELIARIARRNLAQLFDVRPFADLYRSTGRYFSDPRLRQLFARYATYCGSSPFAAPATLQLIAHVELAGVWYVDGGMRRIADALASLAERRGALLRYQAEVRRIRVVRGRVDALELTDGERIEVAGVICNADQQALAAGAFGA
ncbi:MAG: FAD-dependent oxidoreductase, partial [Gammaproteobacteria bacterium]|nr:FAD-dependent oxidoreductase [Gammaproteobacteria bacterium]